MKRMLLPSSGLGWWAASLGLAAAIWGLAFPGLAALVSPLLRDSTTVRIPLGFSGALIAVLLGAAAIVTGAVALGRGQRSWVGIGAFALAVPVGGFWILFALGEVLMPH